MTQHEFRIRYKGFVAPTPISKQLVEIHVTIAFEPCKVTKSSIPVIGFQSFHSLPISGNNNIIRSDTGILLSGKGRIVRVISPIIRALHLNDQQRHVSHALLEHRTNHAGGIRKDFPRVCPFHRLDRINHICEQNRNFVLFGIFKNRLKNALKISIGGVSNTFGRCENIIVTDKLTDSLGIPVDAVIDDIEPVCISGHTIQHRYKGGFERTVPPGAVIGSHRTGTLQIEVYA